MRYLFQKLHFDPAVFPCRELFVSQNDRASTSETWCFLLPGKDLQVRVTALLVVINSHRVVVWHFPFPAPNRNSAGATSPGSPIEGISQVLPASAVL